MKKFVAIIGRPNVGKSSIFNCLAKENKAITLEIPGVTRDRLYEEVKYKDYLFSLIDTGGIEKASDDINKNIKAQAMLAIDEADVILFVIDGKEGLTSDDMFIKNMLLKSSKKVLLLVNKLDNTKKQEEYLNYYELGFGHIFPVSASHNLGFIPVLEEIVKDLPIWAKEENLIPSFCVIGRPNVGKSSLVNALLGEERVVVSEIAGTTRDAIDTEFSYNHEKYILVDTAGMRKRGKIYEELEKYSLLRSLKAIERSDVCVLVINAEEGIIEHDKHIASIAIEAGKGLVLVVNKWDMVENSNEAIKKWQKLIEANFQFMTYIKPVFLSAKTKKRLKTLMPEILKAYESNCITLKTSLLNNVITDAVALHQPPSYKGKRLKIYFVAQEDTKPPKFVFNVNNKGLIHFSYERYLENKIRENFDLTGTPIILKFKNKNNEE